jgi:putative hydrolase of HD superfamily
MDPEELGDFFQVIDNLKHSERQGWVDREIERPRDTVASHSFGSALIGWILAEEEGVDSDEVVKRALVHDLIMAFIPDLTPEDKGYENKEELEREKMEELLESLPDSISEEAEPMIREEIGAIESEAGSIAKDADRLDTILQAKSYDNDGELFGEFLENLGSDLDSEAAAGIRNRLEEL